MKRVKIDIIQFGESKHKDEWKFINNLKTKNKSKIFEIVNIKKYRYLKAIFGVIPIGL